MAKFRTYKNGIFGHKYKGYYILRNNANQSRKDKLYWIVDEDGNIVYEKNPEYSECEWYLDKLTATKEEMDVYSTLYECDIPQLHRMCSAYSIKTEEKTITKEEKKLYKIILKIRDRKIADLPF